MRSLKWLAIFIVLTTPALLSDRALPTPASVFGFEPGADNKLATYDQTVSYFKQVDAASDRVRLVEAGTSTQGRTYYFALVSSPANLRRLDRLRAIAWRLAHPDGLSDDEARRLAREGKPFVHIDGGLHSTEVAGPQHTSLLLYDLVRRADEPDVKMILDNVVLMLWPTINPDGQQMVAEWFMSHQDMQLPQLYQEYVGHDNNRDAYMLNTVESRVMEHAWRQWEPNLVYVHHQSAPFPTRIWLPPFAEPIATHAPYIVSREVNMIGMAIAKRLDEEGKVGATHMGTGYDAWYPGYIDYMPVFKNIPAFWTETQGTGPAPRETPPSGVNESMRRPQALYASPWLGGTWRLRDAVEYMETASIATLDYAARYRESLLYDRYLSGRDQIARGRTQAPYAYVFPREQRDQGAAVELLRRLAFSGVRVYALQRDTTFDGKPVRAGAWIVPTDQEFAALAREVLDVQTYPEIRESPGGPLDQPYDAAGWTLPLAMGVSMSTVASPIDASERAAWSLLGPPAGTTPPEIRPYNIGADTDAAAFDSAPGIGFDASPAARAIVPTPGAITGTGPALALNPAENNTFKAMNRTWKLGGAVTFTGGRYVIRGLDPAVQDSLVKPLGLTAGRVAAPASASGRRPRIGLWQANTSMDEGWTRWVLDRFEFEYQRITGADIQSGALAARIDVLLITDESRPIVESAGGRGGRAGGAGGAGGAGRGAGAAGADQNATNEARMRALEAFIRGGGTVICFNRSSSFLIDQLKLPVKNVVAGVGRQQFFVGGSLLNVDVDVSAAVMAGMPERAAVFYDSGPVFEPQDGFTGTVLARYPAEGAVLASGFLQGESLLRGKAAALDVPIGAGHVVLLGFRPQWRGQPFGTFRIFFNAICGVR